MYIRVSSHSGTDIDSDRRRVDQLDLPDPFRGDRSDMPGQRPALNDCFQGRDQALQDQRGLAGTGNPCDRDHTAFGKVCLQRPDRMDLSCGEMDPAHGKHFLYRHVSAKVDNPFPGQKRSDPGSRIILYLRQGTAGDHGTAFCPGFRSHFDQPVRFF